jgi:hypothetical protein
MDARECLTHSSRREKEIVSVISTYIVSEPRTTMQTAAKQQAEKDNQFNMQNDSLIYNSPMILKAFAFMIH